MATIVTRAGKGSALTHNEMDANFTNLNTDKIELTNISVTDSGGDGSLAYNNSTGVITYTGPSASEVRAHVSVNTVSASSGGALAYDNSTGVFTFTPAVPGTATTINNNADNRIITGSGSANTLEGESTLQYDGTSLSNTTAPSFTQTSTPIQLNGTQPNQSAYFSHITADTGTSRGAYTYASRTAGGANQDRHILFFDLDDDYGNRPTGAFQGDFNVWFNANHSSSRADMFFDGFDTAGISAFGNGSNSYALKQLELNANDLVLKGSGSTVATISSTQMQMSKPIDLNNQNLTMGGGTIDLENGSIVNTSGNITFADNIEVAIDSSGTNTITSTNSNVTGIGIRSTVGTAGTPHSSGTALLVRRSTASGFQELLKVESTGTNADQGVIVMNNIDQLTTQDVVTTTSGSTSNISDFAISQFMEIVVNGNQRYIPLYTRS